MRRLLMVAAIAALAVARPETYREKEDFQYSRSSSDEGHKSGYYGAQRGNMGGNYERAHNMDTLAQHQLSGAVKQVQGEIGDGAAQRSGSVFTSANSRGVYGSGHYDLSGLEGRNFQEGVTYDNSQSHSSIASHKAQYNGQLQNSYNRGGYGSSNVYNSRYKGYNTAGNSDQMLYADVQLHNADDLQSANHESRQDSHNSGYVSQSGYHGQNVYNQASLDSANGYDTNVQHSHRLVGVSTIPVKVVLRPGTRVSVPVAAQTYDISQGVAAFDHNAISSEGESLNRNDQHIVYKPTSNAKHYESSYSYRKEWEKQNGESAPVGLSIPTTINPYPRNSELYEDTYDHNSEQRGASSAESHAHSSHRSYTKSASTHQSNNQADYKTQHQSAASNGASSTYNLEANNAALSQVLNNQVEDFRTKPKSYQSSYSYHKSWERQGDPYVIKPVSPVSGDASQRLTSASVNHGVQGAYGDTRQYGTHYHYGTHRGYVANAEDCDCDENGHVRVARSYNLHQQQRPMDRLEDLGQQTQNLELTQQNNNNKWDRIEDIGQQTQNLGTVHKWDKMEDLGQQTDNQWGQNRWDRIEDLGQQTQNQWVQESHSNWRESEPQIQNVEQTQNKWVPLDAIPKEVDKNEEHITGFNVFHKEPIQTTRGLDQSFKNQEIQSNDESTLANYSHTTFDKQREQKQDHFADLGQQTQDNWSLFHQQNEDALYPTWNKFNHREIYANANAQVVHHLNTYYGQYSKPWRHHNEDFINIQHNQDQSFYQQHNLGQYFNHQNQGQYSSNNNGANGYQWQIIHPDQSSMLPTNTTTNAHASQSPLSSFWDKLDNIEKESQTKGSEENYNLFQSSHTDFNLEHIFHQNDDKDKKYSTTPRPSEIATPTTKSIITTSTKTPRDVDELHEHRVPFNPEDIGRGDIGPEDLSTTTELPFKNKSLLTTAKPLSGEIAALNKDLEETSTLRTTSTIETKKYQYNVEDDLLSVLSLEKN